MSFLNMAEAAASRIKNRIDRKRNNARIEEHRAAFKRFNKQYIKETSFVLSKENIPPDFSDCYDYFVVGSDQVWNPAFRSGSPIDFLRFAPEYKRIAYAVSFGAADISGEFVEKYRQWITEMAYLSVREQAGADIIKRLTSRDAEVLVDPTLMLSREKWLSIAKPALEKPRNQYILTLFFGDGLRKNQNAVNAIALKNKLEIVNLAGSECKPGYVLADPGEFLDYINSAAIVFTDSFHATVFSILLKRPFIVFERGGRIPSMNSRIDTLLLKFGQELRKWKNFQTDDDLFNVDFSRVPKNLEIERKTAFEFLKTALDVKTVRQT